MVADLAIYTVVHQPRRLKLPAQPIPRGASIEDITRSLFDERMNERYFKKVARYSYYPAAHMFQELVRRGLHFSIGFSLSFIQQAEKWEPALLDLFRELVAAEHVELVGVEPYHSFLFLFDLPTFAQDMQWMANEMERIFGKRPTVTDTTEMAMSASIYDALDTAGFRGALMDGRKWVLGWREPTYLYRNGDEGPYPLPIEAKLPRRRNGTPPVRETPPYLLTRHVELSDDVGYRFSNHNWDNYPLMVPTYVDWIAQAAGDFVFLGWDFETFGEHHRHDSGIFDFMRMLPLELERRGIATRTPGELIDLYGQCERSHHLPLPVFPSTWAGSGGMEFFLGNSAQQAIYQLMGYIYNEAKLIENPALLNLARWMAQSDNLHLIQWYGRGGPEAEVSSYFTPQEWWSLGPEGIIQQQQQVYINLLYAMEPYLPVRAIRRAEQRKRQPRSRNNKQAFTFEPELEIEVR
ncbi:MAG TPA: glycoside hydrolase family 57 protein [Ktedonobacteraceae bacterium]|nr:glycoside hydrolase family 57 protein [Ktedonobacteraceae bacterium]